MLPLGSLGLRSLHDIVEAIAGNVSSRRWRRAGAGFLRHGAVGTIQRLVALPATAAWAHLGRLQEDMVFLGAMLLPAALAAGTLRYWLVGLPGPSHQTITAHSRSLPKGRGSITVQLAPAPSWESGSHDQLEGGPNGQRAPLPG